ncbi:HlyD family efflux transporter periplasmic adaptor subunit [Herbaspirillum sp. AP02]|uniref:HlyD family secretion protein n=1 Tax=unclassified Herbaspirillum TaxID=2624150 RepID=UPI0015DA9FD6|nr:MULTISPECIES: HlyD family efflux transporter periplasmic adaptor subunit [unclassified Herbaspirillum]MBG7619944.1 HlyD family efflux transporter periplasmic adaptor subunit [Herbaspirillum sp. AP02]NZD68992.1 HlyD family efflux transporter periplasmic adaptor subunit [Herbaspirillum sp. AP21]
MSDSTTPNNAPANGNANGNGNGNGKRKRQLILLTLLLLVIAAACFLYWFLHARFFEETDDAYVGGNVVQISAQVGGTVVAVKADDTQIVKAGQPLVALDAADTRLALDQAQAALAQAVRQTRQLFLNNDTLAANVAAADANLARAREDLQRRQAGLSSGAVSQEDVSHARDALKSASAALDQARAAAAANRALTDHTSVTEHPNVLQAATAVRNAYLNYARVNIVAPVSGFVSKRSVQVGQRIAAGNPLMAIVPLEQIWIDANFKEGQLQHIRIGQPVEVIADVYGSSVKYKGTVIGFSAGTGGAFSLLPAQNATGNWIKVVQRVPVRIALDPEQVRAHPLRIGLSTTATVDIHGDGRALEAVPTNYQTNVYDDLGKQADAIVERIISDNASGLPQARKSKAAATPAAVPHT